MYKWMERMFGGNSLPVERIRPAKVRVIAVVQDGCVVGCNSSVEIDFAVCDLDQTDEELGAEAQELEDECDLLPFKS
jgi:hypothetical protein